MKMAKGLSAERALQLILEEREFSDDDVEEEVSECEDHISENTESDSDFEAEHEVDHQLVPKQRQAAHQQQRHLSREMFVWSQAKRPKG